MWARMVTDMRGISRGAAHYYTMTPYPPYHPSTLRGVLGGLQRILANTPNRVAKGVSGGSQMGWYLGVRVAGYPEC